MAAKLQALSPYSFDSLKPQTHRVVCLWLDPPCFPQTNDDDDDDDDSHQNLGIISEDLPLLTVKC